MDEKKKLKQCLLEAKTGVRISLATGELEMQHPDRMSTLHFYKAVSGSRIKLLSSDYSYAVATYSLEREMSYIYTYSYQKEENWTTYNHDLTPESYRQQDYIFYKDLYFRVNLKRNDGGLISEVEADNINEILNYITLEEIYEEKQYFTEEVEATVNSINEMRTEHSMLFAILTDTHYVVNGTWEDTAYNLMQVHKKVGLDGIIHLGDFTDGMVPAAVTREYVERELRDLLKNQIPIYFVLGNHDSNYFKSNPERMSRKEQQDFYFSYIDSYIKRGTNQSYYFVDYEKIGLRGIFLESYNFEEKLKYGFSEEEMLWLQETLDATPKGYSAIVFSHVPPLGRLHYWTDQIRNSDVLMNILEAYNTSEGKRIMAFIHGHNHADQIFTERSFPIIAIGCAKCEYFTDKKPRGSDTYNRTPNTVTQELWDVMIITPTRNKIDFVRFGAGEDRTITIKA